VIVYRCSDGPFYCDVSINVGDRKDIGKIQYQANPGFFGKMVESSLRVQSGLWGHTIGGATNPPSLAIAMQSKDMQRYAPVLLEGEGLTDPYEPNIPKGAVT
jgi:hypothetical protein